MDIVRRGSKDVFWILARMSEMSISVSLTNMEVCDFFLLIILLISRLVESVFEIKLICHQQNNQLNLYETTTVSFHRLIR